MTMFVALAALLTVSAPLTVYGAVCSDETGTTCEATDHTLATCNADKTCGCEPGYIAIKTGCAKRLAKPTVTLPLGRTAEVITGTNAILTCTTDSAQTGVTYTWKRGNTVITGETSQTYTINSADDQKVGEFSCIAKYTNDDNVVLDSEESDKVAITLVTGEAKSSNVPAVSNIPQQAAEGALLSPAATCTNIPMGADYKFVVDNAAKNSPVEFTSTDDFTFDSSTQKTVKCVLDVSNGAFYTTVESPEANMPTVASDISSVSLQVVGGGSEFVYKTGTEVSLQCTTSPMAKYMDVDTTVVAYAYTDTEVQDTTGETQSVYAVQDSEAQAHTVTCKATYSDNNPRTSNAVTITFSADYIENATLIASGTHLLPKSRLVLTCGAAQDDVTYSWKKGTNTIFGHTDRILQIGNFVAADDAGDYTCTASKNNYVTSSSVTVQGVDTLQVPSIACADLVDGTKLGADGNFILVCSTTSATAGMTYTWKRNNTVIPNTERVYAINGASASKHDGLYVCTVTFNNLTPVSSPGLQLQIIAAGKKCTTATAAADCTGDGYTATCGDDSRCECATEYFKRGNECTKSSATTAVSSTLLILAVTILSRLF